MLNITVLALTPIQQNTRILTSTDFPDDALIIDPAGESEKILAFLKQHNLSPSQIWLTHSHLDHCGGVADVKAAFPEAKLLGHQEEKFMRERVEDIAAMYGVTPGIMKNCPEPDRYIQEGELLTFGGYTFAVRFVPGHSPGHVVFYQGDTKNLIAGDTLFAGSIGRTDLPGGNHQLLLAKIEAQIFTLPDETVVHPGHGPNTTVGEEKRSNPFFESSI